MNLSVIDIATSRLALLTSQETAGIAHCQEQNDDILTT